MISLAGIRCAMIPPGVHEVGVRGEDRFASATEGPLHRVEIASPVAIASEPVTEDQYSNFDAKHGIKGSRLPVVKVSWDDATAFCDWFRAKTSIAWRLPWEAEWEIACRAGSDTPFSTGTHLPPGAANYLYDEAGERVGPGHRTEVGAYPPNAWGISDMHGNVLEWCADEWRPNHEDGTVHGGSGKRPGNTELRVVRGGAWDLLPRLLRSAWRDGVARQSRRDNLGFRLAATLMAAL
jgi:formylglycine-generating enzyme required for sulfatase activity